VCEGVHENAAHQGANSKSSSAANVFPVHSPVSYYCAWYSNDRGNGVVTVDDVVRGWGLWFASILKILREESEEQGIGHTNADPDEPDQQS
jgi:hypothetical protein